LELFGYQKLVIGACKNRYKLFVNTYQETATLTSKTAQKHGKGNETVFRTENFLSKMLIRKTVIQLRLP